MNRTLTFIGNNLKSISYKICNGDNRLRSINLAIIGGLFFCISSTFGQNTTIVFSTKENSTIRISKEIDNTCTPTLTDEVIADEEGNCIYSWDVNNFQFMECSFNDGGKAYFPIKEGDRLTIVYKGDHQFEFEGVTKEEVEYYTNHYKAEITRPFLGPLFGGSPESSFKDISLLIEKYDSALTHTLDSLVAQKKISPMFSDMVKNDFHLLLTCTSIGSYRTKYLENTVTKVNGQDSIKVENMIDGILCKITPMIDSGDILKYSLGKSALAVYYTNKYRHLSEKEKEELVSTSTWAKYLEPNKLGYLIAPEETMYKLLSLELLDNYANGVTISNSELFNYILEIRPQNPFLPYLREGQSKLSASVNADHSEVKYIESTINTLEDLSKVDAFEQKALFIDLWATWCAPCIAELKHKDKLQKLLSNYADVIPVYISIDEDKNDALWKEKTKIFDLNSYNLRANQKLIDNIYEKLYKEEGIIGIPRYILLDKNGNILEKNLPYPSNIDKLKQELDKHFINR